MFDRGFISVSVDALESKSSLQERPDKTIGQVSKHCCMLSLGIPMVKQTIPPSFFPAARSNFWLWSGSTQLTSSSHILLQSFHLKCSFDLFRALMYFTRIHEQDSKTNTTSTELGVNTVCRLAWWDTTHCVPRYCKSLLLSRYLSSLH